MEKSFIARIIGKNKNGTGMVFKDVDSETAIVITCKHCIDGENKENIKIRFNEKDYSVEDFFLHQDKDIAAILLKKLKSRELIPISIESKRELNSKELLIEGYPEVANKSGDCSKTLNCTPRNERMREKKWLTLKLDEKINDTSSSSEKEKLEGFSGSPVFYNKDNRVYVVGMLNEIESDNGEDVNYNDVMAIWIEDILLYLYQSGVLFYHIEIDGTVELKWVYNRKFEDYISKKILVIGGSGAGKSSFIRTFAMNYNLIDSSGDGQTTRSDIEYQFFIKPTSPKLTVTLLSKEDFVEKMIKQIEVSLLSLCLWILLGKKYDIENEIDIVIKGFLRRLNQNSEKKQISEFINKWYEINEKNSDDKYKELMDLNYDLIDILFDAKNELCTLNFDETLADIEKNELKKILLVCKGFFKHTEYDFLDEKNSQEIEKLFYEIFKNVTKAELISAIKDISIQTKKENTLIEKFYKELYSKIRTQISNHYNCSGNKILLELLDFNKQRQNKYDIVCLLKVVDGFSLTSMVSKTLIEDMFNNHYSWIMDGLNIKEICLIDTCGLDHVETGEPPVEIIKEAFAKRNDDIKTVFYVKKLDSGRPTELERIIPAIYKVQSNAAVYCILNGADILYPMHNFQDIITFNEMKEVPNSIKYLLSEEGRTDIIQSIKEKTLINGRCIGEGRCKILYSVLVKNLIPYCSKIENSTFNKNNKYYIKHLFNSIAVEEHLGLDLITEEVICYVEKKDSKFNALLKECLKEVFREASITDWTSSNYGHGHWKVKDANIVRISKYELGYARSYDDRWSIHFKDAYQYVFSVYDKDIGIVEKLFELTEFDLKSCYDKLESILIDFKDEFFGCPKHKYYKIFPTHPNEIHCDACKEVCFRNLIIEMHNSDAYQYHWDDYEKVNKVLWLNEMCDFSKGFEHISDKLIQLFKSKFLKKLKSENSKNINLILKINPEIERDYRILKKKIMECFLGANEKDDILCKKTLEHIEQKKNLEEGVH